MHIDKAIFVTYELCKKLEELGIKLLCVHGRTKEQNKEKVGAVNWEAIRIIKEMMSIPVIANGIQNEGIMGYTSTPIIVDKTVTVSGRGTIGYSIYRDYPYYPIVRLIVLICPTLVL